LLPLPDGTLVPVSDAVPTCVARGPDGYLYVGTLAFGANFGRFGTNAPPNWASLPPQSKVYRVDPDSSEVFLTETDVWASGFNPITACGFHGTALYPTEYATQDSGYATGDVVRVHVIANGTAGTRTTLGAGALYQPNGLAFDEHGKVYVSNHSISSGGGQVVRINY
jgi:sugar lactone lactonase YvrE